MGLLKKATYYRELFEQAEMNSDNKNLKANSNAQVGLLNKATVYHELFEKTDIDKKLTTDTQQPSAVKVLKRTHKLSRLMKIFAVTALLTTATHQSVQPTHQIHTLSQAKTLTATSVKKPQVDVAKIQHSINIFQKHMQSRVSYTERVMLAKLLYGEAGCGTDPVEVIHTVLNRMSSPLFKGDMASIITQKNQYVGYNENNPIVPGYMRLINFVVQEWEDNGCQPIHGCDRYYFVTGQQGYNNKFEISHDHQGRWVPNNQKDYAKHYCATAYRQSQAFYAHDKINRRETVPAYYFAGEFTR